MADKKPLEFEREPLKSDDITAMIAEICPRYRDEDGKPKAVFEAELTYDSVSETLEPVYFWILDMMGKRGLKVEKLIDNFSASPGSGHFAELGARMTKMQDEAMKIMGAVNTVIKSIINILYDLKEFEIRLKHYDVAKSKNKDEKEAGILALKQIWMDNVDIKRGRGSINMLAYDLSFTTLRDAFMKAQNPEDVDKMDLNDRVKRILKPRVAEFIEWWKRSEQELKKRYEIEKSYLKSQVSALQLYTRWAKPYLKTAERLRMKDLSSPDLVTAFNTIVFELALFGVSPIGTKEVQEAAYSTPRFLPLNYANVRLKRNYNICLYVDFMFRGIPQRISQEGHYAFGGKANVKFKAFALNDDELFLLKERMKQSDLAIAFSLVEQTTTESLGQIQGDIDYFLKKEDKPLEDREKRESEDVNPFSALFSFIPKGKIGIGKKAADEAKKLKEKELRERGVAPPDAYAEKVIRAYTEWQSAEVCFLVYDVFKKTHDMASIPGGIDFYEYFKSIIPRRKGDWV